MQKTALATVISLALMVAACTDLKDDATDGDVGDDTASNDIDEGPPEDTGDADDTGDVDDTGVEDTGPTIFDIQTHVIAPGETVTLEGVVVSASYTPNNLGFFISEPGGGPNNGLWVFAPFMHEELSIAPGQVLTITGTTAEYAAPEDGGDDTGMADEADLPDTETQTQLRIADPLDVVVTGSGEIPPSTVIESEVLANPETAEPYEGVLVTIDAPTVESPYTSGRFMVNGGSLVGNLYMDFGYVRLGDSFASITGVVYSKEREYLVSPRSNADVLGHADTCGVCTADKCIGDVAAGALVVTELMPNPDACGERDASGEYIEVYNTTEWSIDLNCLELTDAADHYGFIEVSTIVEAGGYAVLQRRGAEYCYDDAIAASGAPTAVYRKKVTLNNEDDSITLGYGDVVFDSVSYTADWPFSEGVAMQFSEELLWGTPADANDAMESWCAATDEISGGTDKGSPGSTNGACTGL
jgi:hypothetical protein